MLSILNVNSLVHWEEREILRREAFIRHFSDEVRAFLRSVNPAWDMRRVEAPTLIPRHLISDAYGNADVWVQQQLAPTETELVLRPETTPSTYAYMTHLLDTHTGARLPLCVWQAGRSYRREQEQTTAHMRLKEFWQMEFQAAFTADTGMDYHAACLEPVRKMIASVIALPTRIVPSDRLPSYSEVTMDIEVDNGFKAQWEQFLRYVIGEGDHRYDFFAGARGVRLAEAGLQSSAEGRRLQLGELVA